MRAGVHVEIKLQQEMERGEIEQPKPSGRMLGLRRCSAWMLRVNKEQKAVYVLMSPESSIDV